MEQIPQEPHIEHKERRRKGGRVGKERGDIKGGLQHTATTRLPETKQETGFLQREQKPFLSLANMWASVLQPGVSHMILMKLRDPRACERVTVNLLLIL